jgi:hypothetical protein
LTDRTSVELATTVTPDLHRMLQQYAALCSEAYGREESVADCVPVMLAAFLECHRSFASQPIDRHSSIETEPPDHFVKLDQVMRRVGISISMTCRVI